jgi:Tol biopolymer transport system component
MDTRVWILTSLAGLGIACGRANAQPIALSTLTPVSTITTPSRSGGGNSFAPDFSADGRYVVFVSQANNLAANDDYAPYLDVFRHDLFSEQTLLVSVNASGHGAGNADANCPVISADGRWVAFESAADNLAGNDTNRVSDVFLRDMQQGITWLVSVAAAGNLAGNGASSTPLLSSNGQRVIFVSTATNLVANDTNGASDIFLRDLFSGMTTLVSARTGDAVSGNCEANWPSLTPGAERMAFVSTANDLVPGVTNTLGEIYVRDVASNITRWASGNATSFLSGSLRSYHPVLSAHGRFVVFKTLAISANATNPVLICRHDLETGETALVSSNVLAFSAKGTNFVDPACPQISGDGRFVAYEAGTNVFVWDAVTGSNSLVNVNRDGTGPGNGASRTPLLSDDGRKIAFLSAATDLVTNTVNGKYQLYVRDLEAGSTHLASGNVSGSTGGNLEHSLPALAPDGNRVGFESDNDTLVSGDHNRCWDVFVRDLTNGAIHLLSQRAEALPSGTLSRQSVGRPLGRVSYFGPEAFNLASFTSADGRFLVFSSLADDWTGDWTVVDTNGTWDIFVQDLQTGSNALVSVSTNGVTAGNAMSWDPVISPDGRWVAFTSAASNLVADDTNGPIDVFVRDLLESSTSYYLFFQLFVRDLWSNCTYLVSIDTNRNALTEGNCSFGAFSGNGQVLAFTGLVSNKSCVFVSELVATNYSITNTTPSSTNIVAVSTIKAALTNQLAALQATNPRPEL